MVAVKRRRMNAAMRITTTNAVFYRYLNHAHPWHTIARGCSSVGFTGRKTLPTKNKHRIDSYTVSDLNIF